MVAKRSTQAAIDSTGYEDRHTSEYYGKRSGLRKTHFPKQTTVCDTRSHMYFSGLADQGPKPDDIEFRSAVTTAFRLHPFREILADAGYDAEHHHRLLRRDLGVRSIIPPTRGRPTTRPATGHYRRLMQTRFPKKRYGQRWQLESCFSQDKRRFGSSIEGHTYWSRCRKLLLRVLVHNVAIILRTRAQSLVPVFSTEQACPLFFVFSLIRARSALPA